MGTTAAVILFAAITAYAVFGGADFGAGFWDLVAGGAERGRAAPGGHRPLDRPVWEANHVWLIFGFVRAVDLLPGGLRLDHADPVRPADARRFGIVLRGASFAFRKSVFRTRDRRNFGAAFALSSVLVPYCFGAVVGGIASGRVPAGGKAGDPWDSWVNPTSVSAACSPWPWTPTSPRSTSSGTPAGCRTRRWWTTSGGAPSAPRSWPEWCRWSGIFVLHHDAEYLFDGLTSRALPLVILSVACGPGALAPAPPAGPARRPAGCRGRGRQRGPGVGRGPVGLPAARDLTVRRRRRLRGRSRRSSWPPGWRCCSSCRPSRCCTSSTRRACCPRRAAGARWDRRPRNRDERWVTGGRRVGRDGHHPLWVMHRPLGTRRRSKEWQPTSTTTSSSSAAARAAARSPTGSRRPASGSCSSSAATTCRASGTTGTPPRCSSRASTGRPEFWFDEHGDEFPPEVNYYVGGNTKFYGAALFRLRPRGLRRAAAPRRHLAGLADRVRRPRAVLHRGRAPLPRARPARRGPDRGPGERAVRATRRCEHEPRIQQLSDDLEKQGLHPFHLPIGVDLTQDEHGRGHPRQRVHPLRPGRRVPVPGRRQVRRPGDLRRPGAASTTTSRWSPNAQVERLETDPSRPHRHAVS